MPSEAKKTDSSGKTSDQLVEELLDDIRNKKSSKDEDGKEKKRHKHKKEKKKKHKHRSRSKERKSRKRSRSRSKDKKKSKKGRHRYSSASTFENLKPDSSKRDKSETPVPSCSSAPAVEEDDDLPVGADFQTVLDEARKIGKEDSSLPPLDLSSLPCEPGLSHRKPDSDTFALVKERAGVDKKKETSPKKESQILKKVMESKGPADFIPRNIKLKKEKEKVDVLDSSARQGSASPQPAKLIDTKPKSLKIMVKTTEKKNSPVHADKKSNGKNNSPVGKDKKDEAAKKTIETKNDKEAWDDVFISASDKEWEFSIKPLTSKSEDRPPKKDEHNKSGSKSNRKSSVSPKKKRSDSVDKKSARRRKRSRSKDRKRSRSRSFDKRRRSRSRGRRSRSRSTGRRSRSRSTGRRSRSRSTGRRSRSRSPPKRGFRGRGRRSWSRGRRSRSRTWSRSRSRDRIDKAKLLQIARKRRAQGIFDIGDENPKSVEDFVSYCEKLQRKQDKEDRRAKGEAVSDVESDVGMPAFKHPYKSVAEPIKINIINAVPLPTKSTEECILDSAALRVVYPVSSGTVHKENTEWQKVQKEPVPLTCSENQKKFKAMTTLEKEKIRERAKTMGQTAAYFLPPPPAPPALPPPPLPPNLPTAFDTLLPAPPPLPATLIVPAKEKMIMQEPEDVSTVPPRNVADVLARRAKSQRILEKNPNDFDALRDLKDANEQMNAWAAVKSLPGKYTGSTGINILTAEELQPHDPRYNAWVKKDMFKQLSPNYGSGIGLRLMARMGWKPGAGLGRQESGNIEPLTLDVKNDRRGLATGEELPANRKLKNITGTDLSGKHPVSLVMELCSKHRWANPTFTCLESGPPHQKEFLWKVIVNGIEYTSATSSKNKKDGKSIACQVVLQSMGLVPRDPNLPVII